jgi:DNA-binding winged helix-turn-helix (wHTH) protein
MKEHKIGFLRLEKGRVEGCEISQEIPLGSDITIIGRPPIKAETDSDIPDIKVKDDYISRNHMRIYYSHDKDCFIAEERDTGTQNGTFIDGQRIEPQKSYSLKDGCLLSMAKIGDDWRVVFRFREMETTLAIAEDTPEYTLEGLTVDIPARLVKLNNTQIHFRKKEFDLLAFLYVNKGKACSRDEIAQQVWKDEGGIVSDETIDTNIHRIREKLETDLSNHQYIKTLPRYGFRLDL